MIENREISALFNLLDDPDQEVFEKVSERIVSIGRAIIPNLENLWENSMDVTVQERIEMVIHKLHFADLTFAFKEWKEGACGLLQGALLVSQYAYPEIVLAPSLQEIEKMRRNIWLELNSYLTPLEQVNVISGILYSYSKLRGNEVNYEMQEDFLITKLLETKKGNAITNGILYLVLCDMLDLPIKAINIPRQFILGYFDNPLRFPDTDKQKSEKIHFYIDPLNGQVYSQKDVENYFKRISVPPTVSYYRPLTNIRIIQHLLEEYSKCFSTNDNRYKKADLISISNMIGE
ncbi:MAG: transglutaminase-like domain-containing protein [Ginsengibacter sp.]